MIALLTNHFFLADVAGVYTVISPKWDEDLDDIGNEKETEGMTVRAEKRRKLGERLAKNKASVQKNEGEEEENEGEEEEGEEEDEEGDNYGLGEIFEEESDDEEKILWDLKDVKKRKSKKT